MDTAVALVQAYLRMNGCFTVAEYPVLDVTAHAPARTMTDLDILARSGSIVSPPHLAVSLSRALTPRSARTSAPPT